MSAPDRRAKLDRDHPVLSVRRQCAMLGIARSGVYRLPRLANDDDPILLRRIDELFTRWPFLGSRRMTAMLRAEGQAVNRKRVQRLMRRMGIVALGPKPRTTKPAPGHTIFPYLLRDMTVERPNQVWAADITYIPVGRGFLYLVAVMDWSSRAVLAWRLSNTMDVSFCVSALEEALTRFGTPEIFNTDQGSQGELNWSSQHLEGGVAMTNRKRCSARSGRPPLLSPGRPPVAGRDEQRRFWAAIASGMASEDAAVAAGVPQAIGTRWFRKAGGMPPAIFGRSAKPLSGRYLSLAEREELAILRAQCAGVREIARQMGRSASTISRELRRNAATRSGGLDYRATTAQWHADRAARRPKPVKLADNVALRTYVQDRLAGVVVTPKGTAIVGPSVSWKGRRHGPRQDRRWASAWSPEQIAHRLRLDFPHDEIMRISHEAIYQSLYVQGRGALRRELTACLRTGRALRVPRARTRGRGKAFIVPEIMISERPAEVGDRAVPGHWEGDLILGLDSSAIGTLVERTTRFTMLLHLPRMAEHGVDARVKNGPALAGHGAEAVRDSITGTITIACRSSSDGR